MVPADDQAIVFPCASVIVIMVLLTVAFTCATPEAIFLRSRRRTRVASLPILYPLAGIFPQLGPCSRHCSRLARILGRYWSCRPAAECAGRVNSHSCSYCSPALLLLAGD